MDALPSDPARVIQAFVRGDADLTALESLDGISIELTETALEVNEKAGIPVVHPDIADIARGFLLSVEDGGRDWARLLLALNCIDLSSLEDRKGGDELLESVWRLAEGKKPKPETIELVTRLAS